MNEHLARNLSDFEQLVDGGIVVVPPDDESCWTLSSSDQQAGMALVLRAQAEASQPSEQRKIILEGLMRLVDGSLSAWFFCGIEPKNEFPANMDHESCGKTELRPTLTFIARSLSVVRPQGKGPKGKPKKSHKHVPPENIFLREQMLRKQALAFSWWKLLGEEYWTKSDEGFSYLQNLTYNDTILSLFPMSTKGEVTVGTGIYIWKRKGVFSNRDVELVHFVMAHSQACRTEGRNRHLYPFFAALNPALRVILAMLVGGFLPKDIATHQHVEVSGMRSQIREIKAQGREHLEGESKSLKSFLAKIGWRRSKSGGIVKEEANEKRN